MAAKRLTRKLTDVIDEVETQLKAHYGVTQKELAAWQDTWQASMDIQYDGDLSDPAVQRAIIDAFYSSQSCEQAQSSWGQLRWNSGDRVSHIDVAKKQLILNCGCNLCD
jgi:hypothetical protein